MKWKMIYLILLTVAAPVSLAQVERPSDVKVQVSDEKGEFGTLEAGIKSCVSMKVTVTENGHRWTVDANNGCGRILQCTVNLNFKSANGQTGSASCNPSVSQGAVAAICSGYSSTVSWNSVAGSFKCN